MKYRNRLLTGILLVLIGVTMGTLVALYTMHEELAPLAEVRTTEIKKSSEPYFADEDLAGIDERFLFKNIARMVTPTVVYIETIIPAEEAFGEGEMEKYHDERSIWDKLIPRRIRTVGSGVLITDDGYILTNYHVIEGAVKQGLRVVLSDKREYQAKVVGFDPSTDLAVIKINGKNLPSIIIGDSDKLEVGEWVLAVGNPFRLQSTVTAGIVSALSRDVQIINDQMRIESFIQTDAAINKGNSGGALVNTSGQLVGINTAIASQSGVYQGYGFSVPVNLAIKIAADLIEYGEVRRALLGVSIAGVDYNRAIEKGMKTVRGVEVIGVSEDGAAKEAGVLPGDVVLKVNGVEVNESNQLQQRIAVMKPGDQAELYIWRDGKEFTKFVSTTVLKREAPVEVALADEDWPAEPEHPSASRDSGIMMKEFELGFRIMAIARPEDPEQFDLIVANVFEASEAWNRGLRQNYQILAVNTQPAATVTELENLINKHLKKNGSVILEVLGKDKARGFIELKQN